MTIEAAATPTASSSPVPTGEEKQWADLAAEVNENADETAAPDAGKDEAGKSGTADGEGVGGQDVSAQKEEQIPYDELQRRYQGTATALKEARDQAKAFQDQLKAYNDMVAELRATRQQTQAAPAKEEPKEPDPYEDPIGYVNHHLAKIREEVGATKQTADRVQQQRQQEGEYKQFVSSVETAENAFAARTPDYHDAAKYLEEARRAELAIMFPDTPQSDAMARAQGFQSAEHMRNTIFIQDAQTVAANALRAGINPAEAYYNLAKGRGYVRKDPETKDDLAKLAGSAAAKKAEAAVDAARRGQKASRTISGGSGGPDNPLNISDLTALYAEDPEEFDRQWDQMARAGKLG